MSLDDIAVKVPCEYCGAQYGDWCTTRGGNAAYWLHGARTHPVYEAFGRGYDEGWGAGRAVRR